MIRMRVSFDGREQTRKVRLAIGPFHFGREAYCPSTWPKKLVIERIEVNRLIARGCHVNEARTQFIFHDNDQTPVVGRMLRSDFERTDGCNLTQILALLVTEMKLPSRRDLTNLCRPPRTNPQPQRPGRLFRQEPAHNLQDQQDSYPFCILWRAYALQLGRNSRA